MKTTTHNLHTLAIGAHADDVEVGAGGLITKLTKENKHVGIIDLTQSELSSNGTLATRKKEAKKAATILGVSIRETLSLPDGNLAVSSKVVHAVIQIIRIHKPRFVLAPFWEDRHPDHVAASLIVQKATMQAGMRKIITKQAPHTVAQVFYYQLHGSFKPDFIVDISQEHKTKMQAIRSYESQFTKNNQATETAINCGKFLSYLESRDQIAGYNIGTQYGEHYALKHATVGIDDIENIIVKKI